MKYYLRINLTDEDIEVGYQYNEEGRVSKVYDIKDKTIYCTITYNEIGDMMTYKDYLGNWWDCDVFDFLSPFDHETVSTTNSLLEAGWVYAPYLPLVRILQARTIGSDLLSVTPMSAPNVTLNYMDYNYGEQSIGRALRNNNEYFNETVRNYAHHWNSPIIHERNDTI